MNLASLLPANQFRFYCSKLTKAESIAYNNLLLGMLRYSKEITCHGCTVQQIQHVFCYLLLDIPELFFVKNIQIRFNYPNSTRCTVIPSYRFSFEQTRDTLLSMDQKCEHVIKACKAKNSIQKEKIIHDYLAASVQYKDLDAPYSHEAPGALLFQIGVCEGIAKAFKYLSDHVGLNSVVVFGTSDTQDNVGNHAWNMVSVDGVFYHVDVTFDTTLSTSCIRYDYFNLSDTDIQKTHMWVEELPDCPQTYGLYERTGQCFSHGKELVKYIREAFTRGGSIVFKLPSLSIEPDRLLPGLRRIIEANVQFVSDSYSQYVLSYNSRQMVFQIDFL